MNHRPPFRPSLPDRTLAAPWIPAVLVLLGALVAAGCGAGRAPGGAGEGGGPPLNVVLVLADTLRADHLSAYGHHRPTSPHLDALAAGGVLFEAARAQSPCTFPSANSLLTSRSPARFLGQPEGHLGIPPGMPSLATVLDGLGYRTLAVSASPVVRATPSDVNRAGGFDAGFDHFEEACLWREAACVSEAAIALLDRTGAGAGDGEPFFLFLHYMDPHDPYRPPRGAPRPFAGEYGGDREWVAEGDPNPLARRVYANGPGGTPWGDPALGDVTREDLDHLVRLYDDEILYLDDQLGKLLDELERRGLLDATLVVLVSDHGESFLEAGHVKHCRSLFDREIHTPVVLWGPGVGLGPGEDGAPRRVATPVSNLDVVPTVLDYVARRLPAVPGLPALLPEGAEGLSLRPLVEGEPRTAADGGSPVVFSSIGAWRAAADDRFKLIHDLSDGSYVLYDLHRDPEETRDVLAENRRPYHRLKDALHAWLQEVEGGGDLEATTEAQRRLKSLGYLQ